MMSKKLIIFDLDGTIADRDTGKLLPGVMSWFDENSDKYKLAIATNQGGVGLRYWMESGGFGEPEQYPTEESVRMAIDSVLDLLLLKQDEILTLICWRYKSYSSGKWSPVPEGKETHLEWDKNWRKPSAGMLHGAMHYWKIDASETLMVGDSPDDAQAAIKAKCDFMWAYDFFGSQKE